MRTAHLLCDDGITAELWLGALIDAGVHPAALQDAIDRTELPVRLVAERVEARSTLSTSISFELGAKAPRVDNAAALKERIAAAQLPPRADERARLLSDALLLAEAAVHGIPVDAVRLHELGRAHTVARIVAAAVALEELGIDRVTASAVTIGGGSVRIAHGRFPVPAPATLHLLRGFTIVGDERQQELTTPSGAAVLAALAEPSPAVPAMRLERHGRGATLRAGTDGDDQRLLTVLIGEAAGR